MAGLAGCVLSLAAPAAATPLTTAWIVLPGQEPLVIAAVRAALPTASEPQITIAGGSIVARADGLTLTLTRGEDGRPRAALQAAAGVAAPDLPTLQARLDALPSPPVWFEVIGDGSVAGERRPPPAPTAAEVFWAGDDDLQPGQRAALEAGRLALRRVRAGLGPRPAALRHALELSAVACEGGCPPRLRLQRALLLQATGADAEGKAMATALLREVDDRRRDAAGAATPARAELARQLRLGALGALGRDAAALAAAQQAAAEACDAAALLEAKAALGDDAGLRRLGAALIAARPTCRGLYPPLLDALRAGGDLDAFEPLIVAGAATLPTDIDLALGVAWLEARRGRSAQTYQALERALLVGALAQGRAAALARIAALAEAPSDWLAARGPAVDAAIAAAQRHGGALAASDAGMALLVGLARHTAEDWQGSDAALAAAAKQVGEAPPLLIARALNRAALGDAAGAETLVARAEQLAPGDIDALRGRALLAVDTDPRATGDALRAWLGASRGDPDVDDRQRRALRHFADDLAACTDAATPGACVARRQAIGAYGPAAGATALLLGLLAASGLCARHWRRRRRVGAPSATGAP